jgi:hypothetical protein
MSVQSTAQIDTFAAHCAPAWWRPPPRRTTCTHVHSHLTSALFTTAGFTQRWTRWEDGNVRLVVCNAGGNKHGTRVEHGGVKHALQRSTNARPPSSVKPSCVGSLSSGAGTVRKAVCSPDGAIKPFGLAVHWHAVGSSAHVGAQEDSQREGEPQFARHRARQ